MRAAMGKVDQRLFRLAEFLSSDFRTARDIQKRFRCNKGTAYARIAALKKRGAQFRTCRIRQGEHGPFSKAWELKSAPPDWR